MACEPVTVRCGCGATIQCHHNPEMEAVVDLDREQREATLKELGGRFLGEALARRREYLEQSITWCPGCGDAVRVEFRHQQPRIVLTDVEGGTVHWCPATPMAPNTVERLRRAPVTPRPPPAAEPIWEAYDR